MSQIALWISGAFNGGHILEKIRLDDHIHTLDEISQIIPGGAYTTFRTYEKYKALCLDAHIARLVESSKIIEQPMEIDEMELRAAIRTAIHDFDGGEARVRLTLDLESRPGTVYLSLAPLNRPSESLFLKGAFAITLRMRRENPAAKLTRFIATTINERRKLGDSVNEALLVGDDGSIREGITSNFFAVKQGRLWTAGEGVLSGITRSLVIEEAEKEGIKVEYSAIILGDLAVIDEAFITSSSRSALPIVKIDSTLIGSGIPGDITRCLLKRYEARIEHDIEPV